MESLIYLLSHSSHMANMTLSIPEVLHKEMLQHSELRWSDVARQAFEKKLIELHWVDKIVSKSRFTEQDAEKVGHAIKKEIRKRFE